MAVQSPPFALQNGSHSAALFRQALTSMLWTPGIPDSTSFVVTQQSTPNMSVQVAGGQAWVDGTSVSNVSGQNFSTQGAYYALNDAAVTLTIAAADATNPRIDLVYLQINDQFYSGTLNTAALGVVTGTPAGTPAVPSTPSNAIALAQVRVNANATSVTNSNITAVNTGTAGTAATVVGTPIVCTSTTHPTGVRIGQPIWESDTGNVLIYTASGFVQYASTTAKAYAALYQNTAQTGLTANTWQQINLDSETLDNLGGHSTGPGYTVPSGQGGIYLIDAVVAFAGTNQVSGDTFGIRLKVNGSLVYMSPGGQGPFGTNQGALITQGASLVSLTAGQTVTMEGFSQAGPWSTLGAGGSAGNSCSRLVLARIA